MSENEMLKLTNLCPSQPRLSFLQCGWTAFTYAAKNGNLKVLDALLDSKANVAEAAKVTYTHCT